MISIIYDHLKMILSTKLSLKEEAIFFDKRNYKVVPRAIISSKESEILPVSQYDYYGQDPVSRKTRVLKRKYEVAQNIVLSLEFATLEALSEAVQMFLELLPRSIEAPYQEISILPKSINYLSSKSSLDAVCAEIELVYTYAVQDHKEYDEIRSVDLKVINS